MPAQKPIQRLSLNEAERIFSGRPYWEVFMENVGGVPAAFSAEDRTSVSGDYKHDPTIGLQLEHYLVAGEHLPFGSATGMQVYRKKTGRTGTITHGMTRNPESYEEALFSLMLEAPKISTWRCGFDFGLRRETRKLYKAFRRKWSEKSGS